MSSQATGTWSAAATLPGAFPLSSAGAGSASGLSASDAFAPAHDRKPKGTESNSQLTAPASALSPHHQPPPPRYEDVLAETVLSGDTAPSAPPMPEDRLLQSDTGLPPDYFDVSIVPPGSILLPHAVAPLQESSAASWELAAFHKGIESFDSRLQSNPDELWRFFLTNTAKPRMRIKIKGTHEETRYVSETKSDGTTTTTTKRETVADFDISLDVTHHVCDFWSRIVCVPKRNHDPMTLRETIEDFTRSSNILKEIHMEKKPVWDYEDLARAIRYAVRATGYNEDISIEFPLEMHRVSVYSNHQISRLAQYFWVWVLLAITCLWLIAWPAFWLARKRVQTKIVCEYPMAIAGADLYSRNYYLIQDLVVHRAFKDVAAL
ncbi:hypothetical protein HK105_206293 [Polyrhizophydium stewartii]|uniref:Uncharacterized protein n=1 Tax=Polyrhizophydium stewartii TaxID=2732419 RepID=A0ABR4MY82_9FUNG|nr:hypothetical protein HK105_001881 [Polyrhizophydium stewartii]